MVRPCSWYKTERFWNTGKTILAIAQSLGHGTSFRRGRNISAFPCRNAGISQNATLKGVDDRRVLTNTLHCTRDSGTGFFAHEMQAMESKGAILPGLPTLGKSAWLALPAGELAPFVRGLQVVAGWWPMVSMGDSVSIRGEGRAMNHCRFGLRCRPFRHIPDTDFYFPAASHEIAIRQLGQGVDDDEGLMLLTGDPGTGKTLIARKLLEEADENTRCVLLTNSHIARNGDLLQAILFDLGLPYQGLTEQVARLAVTESCLDYYREGGKTLIVVDEAHHLHGDLLEELRLLSNLEGKDGKAVQVLLVALPEIEKAIEKPSLMALRQRLTVKAKLEALDPNEGADYLRHYVQVAGGRPDRVFGEDVLDILTHAANGNPRVLNQAAHVAFSLADEMEQSIVDAEAAVEAVTRLGLDPAANEEALVAQNSESIRFAPVSPKSSIFEPAPSVSIVMREPSRTTIPFPPMIVPIEDGPPTFVYEGVPEQVDKGPDAPWAGPSDRVG